jgi:hypothetical protein
MTTTIDMTALYREDATEDEAILAYQRLVNTGSCWTMDGSTGRCAMSMIEAGAVLLGVEGHRDYYGNYVPSRTEVEPGSKGSPEFVEEHYGAEHRARMEEV